MTVPFSLRTDVQTSYRVQPTHGELAPNDSTARVLEVNAGGGLSLTKTTVRSNAIRPTLVPLRPRHGNRRAGGPLSFDLQVGPHEPLLEAAFRDTMQPAYSASVVGVSFNPATGALTRSTGSWLTDGFKNGDTVTLSAAAVAIGKPILFANVTDSTVTVANKEDIGAFSNTDQTVTRGRRLVMGAGMPVLREFSFEHYESINDTSERYIDARMSSFGINMPAEGAVTVDVNFLATDRLPRETARHFTNAVADVASPYLVTADCVVAFMGQRTDLLQSMSMSWDFNATAPATVGRRTAPNVFDGMAQPTVTLNFMRTGNSILDAFESESGPHSMAVMFREPGSRGGFGGYITIGIPAFTIGSATIADRIGESGSMIESVELLLGPGTAPNVDSALITLCTSETA